MKWREQNMKFFIQSSVVTENEPKAGTSYPEYTLQPKSNENWLGSYSFITDNFNTSCCSINRSILLPCSPNRELHELKL